MNPSIKTMYLGFLRPGSYLVGWSGTCTNECQAVELKYEFVGIEGRTETKTTVEYHGFGWSHSWSKQSLRVPIYELGGRGVEWV